nr:MAG TPA: hypothetical protein [Bacteriophage sp.]
MDGDRKLAASYKQVKKARRRLTVRKSRTIPGKLNWFKICTDTVLKFVPIRY